VSAHCVSSEYSAVISVRFV